MKGEEGGTKQSAEQLVRFGTLQEVFSHRDYETGWFRCATTTTKKKNQNENSTATVTTEGQ